jgi:3',5'-cyclic AMP phosphodiesterase CpdA
MTAAQIALYVVLSQNAATPPSIVTAQQLYAPNGQPDRVRLTWDGDPATSQAVTWRTDETAGSPVAQIALAHHGPSLETMAATVQGRSESVKSDLGWTSRYSTVSFRDLKPKTQYVYRVGDGVNWSEWHHFRTASQKPEPFSFIYIGDAQNGIRPLWSRVIRQAFVDNPKAKFILYAGDLVNRANMDAEWGELYSGPGWVNASTPIVPAAGNHEYSGTPRVLSDHWRPHFELPMNGVPTLPETCYTFDIQGLRVIVLDSNREHEAQAEWLKGVLANNPNLWTVVSFHHPVFSASVGRDNAKLRELWKPILEQGNVDLVLQGHDHTYARNSYQSVLRPGDRGWSPIYIVSVSGSKMYQLNPQPWMVRAAEDTQLYQNIRIEGGRLHYEARTATGDLYDEFRLEKRRPGRSRYVDLKPKSPDFRRPAAAKKTDD